MTKRLKLSYPQISAILFTAALAAVGVFHDAIACFFTCALGAVLAVRLWKEKRLVLRNNLALWAVAAITVCYGMGVLWALDRGMAFVGFLKFLPLGLFALLMIQDRETKPLLIRCIPPVMAAMTLLSALGSLLPGVGQYFLVADRLAGFFQYPNTFALMLLVAQLLILGSRKWNVSNMVMLAILLAGLIYSGSRTVFALAIPANVVLVLSFGSKKTRLISLGCVAGVAAVTLVVALVSDWAVLERFTRFSFTESTFVGRLLYWLDALPVILKHPFGIGYRGYYYIQQSVQTGVYATAYLHNDLLQLMLDAGWLPGILLVAAIVAALRSKKLPFFHKVIVCVIFGHSCFDFDLQFIAVFVTLFLFLDTESGKEKICRPARLLPVLMCIAVLTGAYMGVALGLPLVGQNQLARRLYKANTDNNVQLLAKTQSLPEGDALAAEILEQNEYVTVAYSMRARYAFSQGDFTTLIGYKHEIFRKAPFQYAEYVDYCQMLLTGIQLYRQANDASSASYCLQELMAARQAVEGLGDRLSPLGRLIKDQPTTTLPQELTDSIDALTGGDPS